MLGKCDNSDALNAIHTRISAALSVMKVIQTSTIKKLPVKRMGPPNKNSDTQPRFYFTKRRKFTSSTLGKPSIEEAQMCKETISAINTKSCL